MEPNKEIEMRKHTEGEMEPNEKIEGKEHMEGEKPERRVGRPRTYAYENRLLASFKKKNKEIFDDLTAHIKELMISRDSFELSCKKLEKEFLKRI